MRKLLNDHGATPAGAHDGNPHVAQDPLTICTEESCLTVEPDCTRVGKTSARAEALEV